LVTKLKSIDKLLTRVYIFSQRICPSRKEYSAYLRITKGWRVHSSPFFVRRVSAKKVKYTLIGRQRVNSAVMEQGRVGQIMNLLAHSDIGYRQIGDIVGCSRQRVHQVAKKAGLTGKGRHYRRRYISIEQVVELYHRDLLVKDIRQILGCQPATVMRRLRQAGISKSECYSRGKKLDWRNRKLHETRRRRA